MKSIAVCVGDNCIDYYLPPFDRRFIGGNALNVAVHMQTGGVSAAYVGVVGDDADGKRVLEGLTHKGLDVSRVRILPGQTAQTHIQLTAQGDRQFVYEYLGPQEELLLDEETIRFILGHRLLHTTQNGGILRYLPRFRESSQTLISFDFGERCPPEFIERVVGLTDVAFFSLPEEMAGQAEDLAQRMASKGPRLVVVTLGSEGSLAFDGQFHRQSTERVAVVDTLGAGDCYIGAFLARWLMQETLPTCMQAASRAAAQACTHFGAWPQEGI